MKNNRQRFAGAIYSTIYYLGIFAIFIWVLFILAIVGHLAWTAVLNLTLAQFAIIGQVAIVSISLLLLWLLLVKGLNMLFDWAERHK